MWLVSHDGLKRRLGSYEDADWSPHGLYLVATRPNELAALDVDRAASAGRSLAATSASRRGKARVPTRASPTSPQADFASSRATGPATTCSTATLGRAAGLGSRAAAHARLRARAARSSCATADRTSRVAPPVSACRPSLEWSSDGRAARGRLAAADRRARAGRPRRRTISMLGAKLEQAAFRPGSHDLAVSLRAAGRSEVTARRRRPSGQRRGCSSPALGASATSAGRRTATGCSSTGRPRISGSSCAAQHVRAVGNIRQQFPRADDAEARCSSCPAAGAAAASLEPCFSAGDRVPAMRRSSSARASR